MKRSRVPGTEASYLKRAASVLRRYQEETGNLLIEDTVDLCEWLINCWQPKVVNATWRFDKASLVFHLHSQDPPVQDVGAIELITNANCKKTSTNTSSIKQKFLTEEDILLIGSSLKVHKNKWDGLVLCWLEAATITGLRPSEWETARLIGDELIVDNAKYTNGRGLGMQRVLSLHELTDSAHMAVQRFITKLRYAMKNENGNFPYIYKLCRNRLGRITKKHWSEKAQRPTLYSARHQFSADAKNGYSKEEVAALLGHSNNKTAGEFYGKKQNGVYRKEMVVPDPERVAAVRKIAGFKGRNQGSVETPIKIQKQS